MMIHRTLTLAVLLSALFMPALAGAHQPAPAATPEVQVAVITAKGGYTPDMQDMQANTPGILRFITQGTVDCSRSVVIPALNYRADLPLTGSTDVPVPPQAAGTRLTGSCSMGMYNFIINFR